MQQKPTSHVLHIVTTVFQSCSNIVHNLTKHALSSPVLRRKATLHVYKHKLEHASYVHFFFACLCVCVFSDSHRWTWCCRRKSSRTWRQTGGSIRCIKQDIQQNRRSTVSHGNPVNRICFIFLAAVSYQWFEVSVWKNNCSLFPYVCLLMSFEPTARWALIKLLMMIGAFTPWFSGHYIPIESVSNSQYTPYQGKPIRSIRFLVRTLPVGYDKTGPGCR